MSSKKKISLSISERLYAIGMINEFKGGYDTLSCILKDAAEIGVLSDESKEINLVSDGKTISWDNSKAKDKEIELHTEVVEYLANKIEEKSKAGELTLNDKEVITLKEKLS